MNSFMSSIFAKNVKTVCLWFTTISLLSASGITHAQQSNHEGWYQVEMIVFARNDDAGQEHWPSNITLRYPNNWVELKDPNATQPIAESVTDPAISNSVDLAETTIDLTKESFYWLPENEQQLNNEAKKLMRDSRFELLFHQAWRQIIGHKNTAKSIIINGGKTYGKYQSLEGTITLSVATYLKLQTNLWFSQFDINIGQEQKVLWPNIPLRPNYTEPTKDALTLEPDVDITEALEKENNQWSDDSELLATEDEKDDYVTRQIILIKQARDMRSNEVHYVDHPVVGIIIKVVPYSATASATPTP